MDVTRGDRRADVKQHQRDCPFAQRVVLDTVQGWSPSCTCGPCDHPAEWVRPGVLTGEPFCHFCKTMVVAEKVDGGES